MDKTTQMQAWSGDFGQKYTDRNPQSPAAMDALYETQFGVTRSALNEEFVGGLDRSLRILEVGSNVGTQLQALQQMGFKELYGVELQSYAVEHAKTLTKGINLVVGSAFDLPFRDGWFDLVFTSGVLIHIAPKNIPNALAEVYRTSRRFIWGFEYFAPEHTEIAYRGHESLMWKADFGKLYRDQFPDLRQVKERKVPYKATPENVDCMFMLEKTK